MKHLLKELDVLNHSLSHKTICLFLDFDGTLAPIVETPAKAVLPKATKEVLEYLFQIPQLHLSIISGRQLKNVQKLVGLKGITYAGNHGLEIAGPQMQYEAFALPQYHKLLDHLKKDIQLKLKDIPGALLEDKALTLSIHYRQVSQLQEAVVKKTLEQITQSYYANQEIRINLGKKVFEIKPPIDWDKGKAVMWILKRQKGFPIYIGDDTTDEDAFLALKGKGITVYVGHQKSSHAQYYLNNTEEVVQFLGYLQGIKENEKIQKS